MSKGINFKPNTENRKFLEQIQEMYKAKDRFKGLSQILNAIVTDIRLANTKNPFK